MKKVYLSVLGAALGLVISSGAQTPPGNSSTVLSLEAQVGSPAGQTDFQTDLFTGRFGYTIPFNLAPGRHDSGPDIELLYNSANGNDWCGVGWLT
jgi:hypothetical protein